MWLAYNNFGEVQVTYYQEPSNETKQSFYGIIKFEGEPQRDGFYQKLSVDVETKEVIVDYVKVENKYEEISKLQNQIDELNLLILTSGGVL